MYLGYPVTADWGSWGQVHFPGWGSVQRWTLEGLLSAIQLWTPRLAACHVDARSALVYITVRR